MLEVSESSPVGSGSSLSPLVNMAAGIFGTGNHASVGQSDLGLTSRPSTSLANHPLSPTGQGTWISAGNVHPGSVFQ